MELIPELRWSWRTPCQTNQPQPNKRISKLAETKTATRGSLLLITVFGIAQLCRLLKRLHPPEIISSPNKIPRQPPEIIHVIVRHHISEQVADPLARRNISINLLPARENLPQRPVAQQIPRYLPQRLAGIKHVAIRIHARKHRGIALK